MALFDIGNAIQAIGTLQEAVEVSRRCSSALQFASAFALFVRESDFQAPVEVIPGLTRLRLLASLVGEAHSLTGLHLAVARLEGYRGHCVNAHRHLEIARRFAGDAGQVSLNCSIDLVDASLESIAGNLARSRAIAEACFHRASEAGFSKYQVASATNLAVVAMHAGHPARARAYLDYVLGSTEDITYVKLAALDNLAVLELHEDAVGRCRELLDRCEAVISADQVPARTWYDYANQLTRCSYFERLEDWERVVNLVDDCTPELVRRQYKVLRTALLCARARALAHLGKYSQADAALGTAVRICPRGAVDPLIVLEASKALCLSLRGDIASGAVHFDRALAACRAIGHKFHEAWIERERRAVTHATREAVAAPRHRLEVADTALLLSDVATILGAGHSIDLLAHRVAAILQGTTLGARVDVHSESGQDYRPEPTATWDATADGVVNIRLRGSDRLVSIHVRDVQSIDEISLLKGIADLVQAAVNRTADTESEDEDQNLWPRGGVHDGEDTLFRSPRMVELLKIAVRLAATDLPVLISGETGTGKEIVAHLIHEHSLVAGGPFVAFNCTAIPRELVESQLFGHRRGAFTGATDSFQGVVRTAERGTLFLDEVGDLDLAIQPKLLRFLESAEIQPVGDARAHRVAVRIVAATNADIDDLVEQGRFRRDLFYRLGVARLTLPPLRERKDEIPALAALFLSRYARECRRTGVTLGDDCIAALLLYDWPGNIRQLANEIRRIVALAHDGDTLASGDLAPDIRRQWNERPRAVGPGSNPAVNIRLDQTLAQAVDDLERAFIQRALEATGGHVANAAGMLGLSRKGLFLKRRRQGMVG
jgi:DNA-binding NtrC family response regulator/tetratricopeptide (TPR) repeat protein